MTRPESFTKDELIQIQNFVASPDDEVLTLKRKMTTEEIQYIVFLVNETDKWMDEFTGEYHKEFTAKPFESKIPGVETITVNTSDIDWEAVGCSIAPGASGSYLGDEVEENDRRISELNAKYEALKRELWRDILRLLIFIIGLLILIFL